MISFGEAFNTSADSLVVQMVKKPPVMWETWVQSLGWEDPLEKGMATHSSIPSWRIPWTKDPRRLPSMGLQSQTQLSDFHFHFNVCKTQEMCIRYSYLGI